MTTLVLANGAGAYRVGGVDVAALVGVNVRRRVYAAWWMVVFYRMATTRRAT